jgi:TonB family protein
MGKARRFLATSLILTSSFLYAQNSETKPQDVGAGSAAGKEAKSPPLPAQHAPDVQGFDQLEVLTDTMGVDFGPYLTQVMKTVKQNWYDLMPPSVYRPTKKQGKVVIEFSIQKDGSVKGMKLDTPSGDIALDRAAWGGITASNRFAALPKEFGGDRLGLRFYYYYNPEPITISPNVVAQVAAGSTQQFSASGKGNQRVSATWKIDGPGCSKSPCGTISDDGLYTAPAVPPNPPTVYVRATMREGTSIPAKIRLTVMQATPSH